MDIDFIERLERRLEEDLPGLEAQLLMAPRGREDHLEPTDTSKIACVMALIFPKDDDWHIALIERTSDNPNDPHSGQISLPGGRLEETDDTYADCALRELQEEIGINNEEIGLVGELSSLYVHISDYLIYPFVGFAGVEPTFSPQPSEVKSIIQLPLEHFLKDKNKKSESMVIRGVTIEDVPYYNLGDYKLWGATAMIMSEFEKILHEVY